MAMQGNKAKPKEKNQKLSESMKGNQNAIGNEGGRPTDYKDEYTEKVYKLCLLGATDADIADFFEVTEATINNWKHAHTEFFDSITRGKKIADMEVAVSLYDGARDRTIIKQQAFKVKKWNEKIKKFEENIEVVYVEELLPGDFRNQQFWLKNRKSDTWKDKNEVDHKNNGGDFEPTQVVFGKGQKSE